MTRWGPPAAAWQQAAADAGVGFRNVRSPAEARVVVELLDRVWDMTPGRSHLDQSLVVALAHAGNYVSLALRGDEPVGAALGFFSEPRRAQMHSHIVGVLPGASGRGVGRAIKLHQRAWCLERGVAEMAWTYDPLIARNAYFNIHRLGAGVTSYLVDFYGDMQDGINAGQPSDRILVTWRLDGDEARPGCGPTRSGALGAAGDEARPGCGPTRSGAWGAAGDEARPGCGPTRSGALGAAEEEPDAGPGAVVGRAHDLLGVSASGAPAPGGSVPAGCRSARIAVPRDIEALRKDDPGLARDWRLALRDALAAPLAEGWRVTDFEKSGSYLLEQDET